MFEQHGYKLLEKIYESRNSEIFRCINLQSGTPVIIKVFGKEHQTQIEFSRFKREYEIVRKLDIAGVIKVFGFQDFLETKMYIMEDFGGTSLDRLLLGRPFDLEERLSLAIRMADCIGQIHQSDIIHLAINPSNFVWNPATDILKTIDFGISTELPRENPEIKDVTVLDAALPYISPEQTGRMNRSIDYRSDIYSLGISLYEMFAGRTPFSSDDPLELLHAHIALNPPDPYSFDSDIPYAVGRIFLKMIAKHPENRYQSAFGVKHDLQICLDQLRESGSIQFSELGQKDKSGRFHISQKLYGRAKEIKILRNAFYRVVTDGDKAMVFVVGSSGVGKSALVGDSHLYIPDKNKYIASGKFDLMDSASPYTPLLQAFDQLINQLLSEEKTQFDIWKNRLIDALGINAGLLTGVMPHLEMIIGKYPLPPELPPKESENRINVVFVNFLQAFASKDFPLVLILDDLQWASLPILRLLNYIALSSLKNILMICTSRNEEITPEHPLAESMKKIQQNESLHFVVISLDSLSVEDTNNILSASLQCQEQETKEFSEICYTKTHGNPFFLSQMLTSLYNDKHITFDGIENSWDWDIAAINKYGVSDNVADILMHRLKQFDASSLGIIALAAALGNQFELKTLSLITQKPPLQIANELTVFVQQGYLIPSENLKHLLYAGDDLYVPYKFSHDRILQAAYFLMGNEKENIHLKIGRTFLEAYNTQHENNLLFDIVTHMNKGRRLINSKKEKETLARLNYEAGMAAKQSTSWQDAFEYCVASLEYMADTSWESHYDLSLSLNLLAAESAYMINDIDTAKKFCTTIDQKAKSLLDQSKAYTTRINIYIAQGQHGKVVNFGLDALAKLGIKFPKNPNKIRLLISILKTRRLLKKHNFDNLYSKSEMTDEYKVAAMQVLGMVNSSAYISAGNYFLLFAIKVVQLFIADGYHPQAAFGFTCFGISLCAALKDYDFGYRIGLFALKLLDREQPSSQAAKVVYSTSAGISHWKQHYKYLMPTLKEHYKIGRESGDLEFAAFNAYAYCYMQFLSGVDLNSVNETMKKYAREANQQDTVSNYFRVYHQTVLNFMGRTKDPCVLTGEVLNEKVLHAHFQMNKNHVGLFEIYANKIWLNYIYGEYKKAFELVPLLEKLFPGVLSKHNYGLAHFYSALTICAVYNDLPLTQKGYFNKLLKSKLKNMELWANNAPDIFGHRAFLLKAECLRIKNMPNDAILYYRKAIKTVGCSGFIHEEALCYELVAQFYLDQDDGDLFEIFIKKAHLAYSKWGSHGKKMLLETQHPDIFSIADKFRTDSDRTFQQMLQPSVSSADLDLLFVMKASQAISSEIKLGHLIKGLMKIVVENAGAQIGILLLKEDEHFVVKGSFGLENSSAYTIDMLIPQSVLNYVKNSKDSIILSDASRSEQFAGDQQIETRQIKSLLCIPLIWMNKLIGVLYLENNLTPSAFTADRVKLLHVLASQAAISIENAQLYKKITASLRESENTFRVMSENTMDAMVMTDSAGHIYFWNKAAEKIFGYSQADVKGQMFLNILVPEENLENYTKVFHRFMKAKQFEEEGKIFSGTSIRKNGETFPFDLSASKVRFGDSWNVIGILRDIGDKINLEKQLRGAEKMRAVGRLAGGIAHDFNNLLHAIQTYLSLIEIHFNDPDSVLKYTNLIEESIDDAATMTDQILSFARGGQVSIETTDINELLKRSSEMFKQTKKEIQFSLSFYDQIRPVRVDQGQIKQVVLNLFLNSYQAMGKNKNIYVKTENVDLAHGTVASVPIKQGEYVKISVADTGEGMDKVTLERIFEPFFTTRDVGQGSGLGLASAYGIIKNHKGYIYAESELGKGTTFYILLPKTNEPFKIKKETPLKFQKGKETILLVDDEQRIINSSRIIMETLGYKVLVAMNGKDAIETFTKHQATIDLVILDVIMPEMGGDEVFKELKKINDQVKILVASGYGYDRLNGIDIPKQFFIHKPYKAAELSRMIRRVLA